MKFYVYGLYINDQELPFYIGKGHGKRKDDHILEAKTSKKLPGNRRRIKDSKILKELKLGNVIKSKIIKDKLTEKQAFKLEEELIKKYGRINNNTGILTNMSDGGEGNTGHIWSDYSKNKLKGRKAWNKGKPWSDEVKNKISKANKGKKSWNKGKPIHPNSKKALEKANENRIVSEKTKIILSKISKNRFPEGPMNGKKHKEDTKKLMSSQRKGKKRYANYKLLKIIYVHPEEKESLKDSSDWYDWVPSWGFKDKELRSKYPKSLFYPQSKK